MPAQGRGGCLTLRLGQAEDAAHHPLPTAESPRGLPSRLRRRARGQDRLLHRGRLLGFQPTAAYGSLPSQVVRAMHVGFLLLLGFACWPISKPCRRRQVWFWSLGILGFLTGIYNWVEYVPLIQRSGFLTDLDLVVGVVLIVLVFEAARRLMGLPLAIIAGIFLAYCFFGNYLPPPFIHRGYDFSQIVENFAYGTEGIYGTPIYVSAAYIFIFVVFAAFLEKAGMIALSTISRSAWSVHGAAGRRRSACCPRP